MTLLERPRMIHLVAASTALTFQLLVLPVWRPLILPDEAGFLLNASRLATGAPPSGLNYFPGYSIVVAPLTLITTEMEALARLVQVANGLLGAAGAALAVELARRLDPDLRPSVLVAIGVVVGAYPAYRLFGAFALSENLLVPWTVVLCLSVERTVRRTSAADAAVFGVIAGLSLSIHTRAVALTVAGCGAALILLRGRQLIAALAGLTLGTAVSAGLISYTLDASVDSGAPRDSASSLIAAAASIRGAVDVVTSAGGQIFYLLVATGGIAGLGLWSLIDDARAGRDVADAGRRAIGVLAGLIFAGSIAVSSLFLAGREGDFAIYGRYGEGVLVPLLVAGLVVLASHPLSARVRALRLAFALPLLAGALTLVRGPDAFEGRTLLLNIAGVFPVVDLVGSIRLSALTALGVIAIALTTALLSSRFAAGAVVLVAVFLSTAAFSIDRSAAALDVLDAQADLINDIESAAQQLRSLGDGSPQACIALDIWQLPDRWHQENYRLRLTDERFEYWSSAAPEEPCSDLIVSQRSDIDDRYPGATVVAVEPSGRQALWVLPGDLQAAIDRSTGTIRDPLHSFDVDQRVTVGLTVDRTSAPIGTAVDVTATIDNEGPLGLFPPDSFSTTVGSVNLGLELRSITAPDTRRHEPFRLRLPSAVGAGDAVMLTARLRLEDIDPTIQPGTYLLVASLVQEGVAWTDFSDSIEVTIP